MAERKKNTYETRIWRITVGIPSLLEFSKLYLTFETKL